MDYQQYMDYQQSMDYKISKTEVYELVTNLLATTGAPAFLDNDDGDDVGGSMDIILFATPYGFV